jgi:hypothetical protein
MSGVLLNLDTLVVRPRISINGKSYEILSPDELPVLTSHLLASKGKRMEALMNQAALADEEQDELCSVVCALSDTIMEPVPAAIREKLSDPQRFAVIEAFSTLLLTTKAGTAAALLRSLLPATDPAVKPKSTGAKRSRGSSASTAGRRGGGSRKRRSPS